MAITRSTIYTIACDAPNCSEEYEWKAFDNKASAIRIIRDGGWGWNRKTGEVFCPGHNDFDNG